ncbi:hypothetical protein EUBSIR_01271 [[Eubacterium] siraeum DSM 15702]|uniref:Uncharacterized protein n=1 Tax=[Eubacterium] siraeum DSM 15702 TaxID=428128 RepID=B0MN65_9FIRM|nr:hypothetical protein EUBSIR_01271 [[Eubacterium] siraeum DSM 15702]
MNNDINVIIDKTFLIKYLLIVFCKYITHILKCQPYFIFYLKCYYKVEVTKQGRFSQMSLIRLNTCEAKL